jgi:chorismate mutase
MVKVPDTANFYIIKRKALPEVFLKVVQAKKLLEKEKSITVQEAVDSVGISRSSFYKYKDTIYPFYENSRGRAITIGIKIDDEPGLLSNILNCIAEYHANVLTIHQTIPINGVADITITIEVLPTTGDVHDMIDYLISMDGVHHIKILSRE